MTSRRTLFALLGAPLALCSLASAQNAAVPVLSVASDSPNGLVVGDKSTLVVKAVSPTAKAEPLEIRVDATDWNGASVGQKTEKIDFQGNSSVSVPLTLSKYGPVFVTAGLYRSGQTVPLAQTKTRLVRPVPVPRLDAWAREKSWIGVNTHFNAPWESLAKMGIHWARDYSWGWLAEGRSVGVPVASNGVDFSPTWSHAQTAGITILPLLSHSFYNAEKTGWIDDPAFIAGSYEKISRAFPDSKYFEVDNESEYGLKDGKVDVASYRRYLAAAAQGLAQAGNGARVVLTGTPGVFPEQASALLQPMVGAPEVKNDFSVVNYHYYTGTAPPETGRENTNIDAGFAPVPISPLDLQREINDLAHRSGKQAWLTEIGWDADYGSAVGEHLQATFLPRAYLLSRWLHTDKVFWYFDRDAQGTGKFASCGLIDRDGIARPAAATLAALSQQTALGVPAGSLDLGNDRFAVVLQKPDKSFVVAAWTVKGRYPAPREMGFARAFDVFGNAVKSAQLSPEVTYFQLNTLPPAWEAQRQVELLSRRLVSTTVGASVPVVVSATKADLKWQLPPGFSASPWTKKGDTMQAQLSIAPNAPAKTAPVALVASGAGWSRRFPIEVLVRPAAALDIGAYLPGEPLAGQLKIAGESQTATVSLRGGQVVPARGEVSKDKPLAVSLTAPQNARGPLPLSVALSNGARQEQWLRPRLVQVPRAANLADEKTGVRLDERYFSRSDDDFAPDVRLAWSPQGLVVRARMAFDATTPTDPQNFWEWSGMELFVDTDNSGQGWTKTARQFYFVPSDKDGAWTLRAGEYKRSDNLAQTTFDDARFVTSVKHEANGLQISAVVPFAVLGQTPASGARWRAAVSLRRVSKSASRAEATWPAAKAEGIVEGRNWGVIEFTP